MKSGNPREVPPAEDGSRAKRAADLLPAYVLDAVNPGERLLVKEELAASPSLRAEHHRYQSAVDSLAASTPLSSPPPALRGRVLAVVGQERRPTLLADRRMRVALGVAAAMILALSGVIAGLWYELNERESQMANLQQTRSRPSTDFSQPLVWTELRASAPGMTGSGFFCRTEDGAVGWIVVEGLPVTDGYVYQLWLVDGDRQESAGTFVTDAEGRGFGVVRADEPVTMFEQLWITSEPPGGSPAPTAYPHVSVTII